MGVRSASSEGSGSSTTALLFDRDSVEELPDWEERLPRLRRSSILWIDLESPGDAEIEQLAGELELADESRERLLEGHDAGLLDCESYLHVTAFAPSDAKRRRLERISCLVAERWIVTVHDTPLEVLQTFRDRASGSGATGDVGGLEFLANILEWVLQSYLQAFEEIERSLEEIDATAMLGEISSHEATLGHLVGYRREIGELRRALTSHREPVLALMRPELEAIANSDSAERFADLRERLEESIQAARDSREAVVGSFDVLIAGTSRRTNEIMKILTLASVLLLPGSLIAGVLGMNFELPFFENTSNFWLALAAIAAVAAGTLVFARARSWI